MILGKPQAADHALLKRQDAKIKLLEGQVELLKKLDAKEKLVIQKNNKIIPMDAFRIIKEVIEKYSFKNAIRYLCELSGVSRSGYYNYLASKDMRIKREKRDVKHRNLILKVFNRRGYKKGSRSIKMTLENEFNIVYSLSRIRRIMNKYEIICPYRKANSYRKIAKATKEHTVVKNILNREFKQATPGTTLKAVKKMIDKYIAYYNNYRYQWNLKKMTPVQYRNHLLVVSTLFLECH